jgi:phospholipid transport system substrate-binding protein
MRRFLPLFAKYDDESIMVESVLAEETRPDFFRVSSRIDRAEGEPFAVVWRIRDTGESYRILDVVAEGVSMAISLRHEYGAVAKANGLDGCGARARIWQLSRSRLPVALAPVPFRFA